MNIPLYIIYILFYICLFLTNNFFLAYNYFIYLVVPTAFLPITFIKSRNSISKPFNSIGLSLENCRQTIMPFNSPIFLGFVVFGVAVVISSTFTPFASFVWFRIFAFYFFFICIFMLVTARLAINLPDFYGAFCSCICLIIAINAGINIWLYLQSLSSITDFSVTRLAPQFGRAPDHWPTTGALNYATGLVAASSLIMSETQFLRRVIGGVSGLIFLVVLYLTQSRGPLFAALIAILMSSSLRFSGKQRFLFAFLPVSAAVIFMLIPQVGINAYMRGGNHRFDLWDGFFNLALERPLLGYGQRIEMALEIRDGPMLGMLGHAHNIFISAFVRGGVFAAVAMLITYALSIGYTIVSAKVTKSVTSFSLVIMTTLAGMVDYDQMIFLSDWQWPSFWMPIGLAIATERKMSMERNKELVCNAK